MRRIDLLCLCPSFSPPVEGAGGAVVFSPLSTPSETKIHDHLCKVARRGQMYTLAHVEVRESEELICNSIRLSQAKTIKELFNSVSIRNKKTII